MNSSLSMAHMCSTALAFALFLVAQPAYSKTASEVFDIASKSTVVVKKLNAKGKTIGLGSGVVLPGGDIATNCHVVEGAENISVRSQGKDYPATLRYSDWDRDVCSVSSSGMKQNTHVTMGSTKKLKIGKPVYAIGSPQGLELTLSDGIVSSLREVEDGNYIQTTAAISPGSSGGGLFDENGDLVGLTTFYLAGGQNLNFAVPVEWVTELPKRHKRNTLTSQPETYWINKGIELEERKDWAALLDHCLLWIKSQPQLGSSWYVLGTTYAKLDQPAKSVEAFQQAVRINPEHFNTRYNLAISYEALGQITKSIESYQQAIRINPDAAKSWYNLGNNYVRLGQPAKAIESYQQAIRIDPEDADTWYNLGIAYNNTGQAAKSMDAYQNAIKINPEHANALLNIGVAYRDLGQTAKARESFQQSIRSNSENAIAWGNLGRIYSDLGQRAKAVEAYRQAISINPEYANVWYHLGMAYGASSETSKAIESFLQAIRIEPGDANSWYFLESVTKWLGSQARLQRYTNVLRK